VFAAEERPADLLLGLSQQRSEAAVSIVAQLHAGHGNSARRAPRISRLSAQRRADFTHARRPRADGHSLGPRFQVDQMAAADLPHERLQSQ
jgi:hypothetical protein